MKNRPLIVFDGTESECGRALLSISALYWCLDWLARVQVRFINVSSENVLIAAQTFHWDTGTKLELSGASPSAEPLDDPLAGAALYAGIVFRSADHMRIDIARQRQVPVLLAVQFPDEQWFSPSTLLREDAAFNPKIFSAHLGVVVAPWL